MDRLQNDIKGHLADVNSSVQVLIKDLWSELLTLSTGIFAI